MIPRRQFMKIEPVERIHQDCEWAGPLPEPKDA